MSNRQFKYYVVIAPKDDNRDADKQFAYEDIQSTNASRAGNKVKRAHAEEYGGVPTDYQILDVYRTNAPQPKADADE